MYRKVLLIGLGGSGGKTLRFLKRDLVRWLESRGWTDGVPDGWQFLHIDSPPVPDGLEAGGLALAKTEYLGLVPPGMQLRPVIETLDAVQGSERELTGWRVDPNAIAVPIATGCGQFRSVGRSVGLGFSDAIRNGLAQAIQRISAAGAQSTLDRLYQHVHGSSDGSTTSAPIPIVISSLAGGTGAGLIFDVLDILRSLQPAWAAESIGLWYTPDVFPKKAGDGVHPNSLAAISELLNGSWWGAHDGVVDVRATDSIPMKTPVITASLAGTGRSLDRSGAHCNFLIGSTNARGAQIGTDGTLFEMVGGALLSWVTDLKVQQQFVAYTIANWTQLATDNLENKDVVSNIGPSAGDRGLPAFSALGFSRVSVGTEYLRRYASRRLAKESARHLVRAHIDGDRAQAEARALNLTSPDLIAERLVELELPRFQRSLDVTEVVTELSADDWSATTVLEQAILPATYWEWLNEQQRWVLGAIDAGSDQFSAEDWLARIEPALRVAQQQLESRVEQALPGVVESWVDAATEAIPVAVEGLAAEHGLRVAAGVVEMLSAGLRSRTSGAVAGLEQLTQDYRAYASRDRTMGEVRGVLESRIGPKGKAAASTDLVGEAVRVGVEYVGCSARALATARAALLLDRLVEGLLRPLSEALRSGLEALGRDERADRGALATWPDWADGLPSQDLQPPRSEFTVIEPKEFAGVFDARLRQSFPGQGDAEIRSEVRVDVAGGRSLRAAIAPLARLSPERQQLERLTMLAVEQQWLPGFDVDGGTSSARPAILRLRCSPQDLEARADHWLMRSGYPFERLLSVDLRSYTRSPDGSKDGSPEYVERRQKVVEKLERALVASAPLVELETGLLGLVHPGMTGDDSVRFTQNLSMLPFRGHPLEDEIRTRMLSGPYRDRGNEFDSVLTSDSEMPHVDIISSLSKPVSPLVVASLLRPIGEEWATARTAATGTSSFWEFRRARPLREFVPVPQRHLRCMVRGWFTGRMLGLVAVDAMPFRIVVDPLSAQARVVTFPREFLSSSVGGFRDQAALTLEAMSLAMVEVGRVSSLEPLAAYRALRDLGMSDPGSDEILTYPAPHPVLARWIETGEVVGAGIEPGMGTVHPRLVGGTAEERRTALQDLVAGIAADYAAAHDKYVDDVRMNRRILGGAPLWPGIHDEIQVALEAIGDALRATESVGFGI